MAYCPYTALEAFMRKETPHDIRKRKILEFDLLLATYCQRSDAPERRQRIEYQLELLKKGVKNDDKPR